MGKHTHNNNKKVNSTQLNNNNRTNNAEEREKNEEIRESSIYRQYEIQPIYCPKKVILLDRFQGGVQYESSVRIGKKEYGATFDIFHTKEQANRNALKKAVNELERLKWPAVVPKPKVSKTVTDNLSIQSWAKTLNNETIALLFKDILRYFVQHNNITSEEYKTSVHHGEHFVGYASEVSFNGETFKSLGLMTNEVQAEQSAAEICLRTLGYLPEVDNEQSLTIQPYEGGSFVKDMTTNYSTKPHIFTSKLSSDILAAFVASHDFMDQPRYYVKYVKSRLKKNEVGLMDCICCVDGKFFEASGPQPGSLAIQLAADNAVTYFGISNPHERMEFRKHLRLYLYDHYRKDNLLTTNPSEMSVKSWLWSCFARENSHEECEMSQTVQQLLESPFFLSNLPTVGYQNKLIKTEVERVPSFQGKLLSDLDNLCVADIDATNPNLVTIGNSDFSIKMWCTNGKIYSKQRKCLVDILPGHNILGLNCQYRALPSLEVYLHAVHCDDLSYPHPPKPVVTSCGVVCLFHDYLATSNEIYVLLKKKVDYNKEGKSASLTSLKNLLRQLIQPNMEIEQVTVTQAMEGIGEWPEEDIKLLSEMSMDSLYQVMSKYGDYDSRWNELLARSPLPEKLKEIQDICMNELKRLEEEKPSKHADGVHQDWELPLSEFLSCFSDTGIHIEGSEYCGMRSLAEMAKTKISLGCIEKCTLIDVPVDCDGKKHRGDVSRFYIWNRTVSKVDDPERRLPGGYTLLQKHIFDKHTVRHNDVKYSHPGKRAGLNNFLKIRYVNLDGTKVYPNYRVRDDAAKISDDVCAKSIAVPLPGDGVFRTYKASMWCAAKVAGIHLRPVQKYKKYRKQFARLKIQTKEKRYVLTSKTNSTFTAAVELVCKKGLEVLGYEIPIEHKNKNDEKVTILETELPDYIKRKNETRLKDNSSQSNLQADTEENDKDGNVSDGDGGDRVDSDIGHGDVTVQADTEENDEDGNVSDGDGGDRVDGDIGPGDVTVGNVDNDVDVDNEADAVGYDHSDGDIGHGDVTDSNVENNVVNEADADGDDHGDGDTNINDGDNVGVITSDEYSQVNDANIVVNDDNIAVNDDNISMEDDNSAVNETIGDDNVERQDKEGKEQSNKGKWNWNRKRYRSRGKDNFINRRHVQLRRVPRRDAFCLQCEWVLLSKAIDICPMLKKLTETTQFQSQLNQFVSQIGIN